MELKLVRSVVDCCSEGQVERRNAEYRPAPRWRRLGRVRLFRSVQLNLMGWAAIVVLCLVAAGIGSVGGQFVDLPVGLGSAGGVVAALAGLFVLDRRRWARLHDRDVSEH